MKSFLEMKRLLGLALLVGVMGGFLVPADGQEIPELCTTCYEGELNGMSAHAFDAFDGLEPYLPMSNGVHYTYAYPVGCVGDYHSHTCCVPT